jgi:hypothetical protein
MDKTEAKYAGLVLAIAEAERLLSLSSKKGPTGICINLPVAHIILTPMIDPQTFKLIACATVIEEMLPLMPPELAYEVLDFGLHSNAMFALEFKIDLFDMTRITSQNLKNGFLKRGTMGILQSPVQLGEDAHVQIESWRPQMQ